MGYYYEDPDDFDGVDGLERSEDEYDDFEDAGDASDDGNDSRTPEWAVPVTHVEWRSLRFNDTVLRVSSEGKVRFAPFTMVDISDGVDVVGTPYRMWHVSNGQGDICHYYMHELVWYAFHGNVPSGWEVRHNPDTPVDYGKYANNLEHLNIYPTRLVRMFDA